MRRLDQLISSLGYGSRKEIGAWCRMGRVKVNGATVRDASTRVEPSQVTLEGEPLEFPDGLLVLVNKPVGYVCTHDSREGRRVYDLLPPRWQERDPKVTTIGRLDKDTSGLVLVTDDGALVQKLTSPKHHVEKVYVATLDGGIDDAMVARFAQGLELREFGDIEKTLPAKLEALDGNRVQVTVHEGRYHQVRRMFAAVGRHVEALERTRFGEWSLGSLESGGWIPSPPRTQE